MHDCFVVFFIRQVIVFCVEAAYVFGNVVWSCCSIVIALYYVCRLVNL